MFVRNVSLYLKPNTITEFVCLEINGVCVESLPCL